MQGAVTFFSDDFFHRDQSVELGFGCPHGSRVRVELVGGTMATKECFTFFTESEQRMREETNEKPNLLYNTLLCSQFVGTATADTVRVLYEAYNKVYLSAGNDLEVASDLIKLGPGKTLTMGSEDCRAVAQVQVAVCGAYPKVYIPVRLRPKSRLTAQHLGCGCGSQIVDMQVQGTIVWMKDQLPATQDTCAEQFTDFMREVEQILTSEANVRQVSMKHMEPKDQTYLEWLKDNLARETSHKLW